MPGAYLYGWDAVSETWVKLVANAEGKLIIDPTEIFVDTQVDDEHGKAPTSNWAYDHENNAAGHHARYTDEEATEAWGNRAVTITTGNYTNYDLTDISMVFLDCSGGNINIYGFSGGSDGKTVIFLKYNTGGFVYIYHNSGSATAADRIYTPTGATVNIYTSKWGAFTLIYKSTKWYLSHYIITVLSQLFDPAPVNGETNKGITSNWAYDHAADLTTHVTNGNTHDHVGGDGAQIDHTGCSNIGSNTHAQIDTHMAPDYTVHVFEGNSHDHEGVDTAPVNHNNLTNKGTNTHGAIDSHIASTTVHVTNGNSHDHTGGAGAQIDHVDLASIGTNTHAQIDTHIADFTSAHVTNGNTHNHLGGDGGQVAHSSLSGLTNLHVVYGEGAVSSTPTLTQIVAIFGNAENYGSGTVGVMYATSGTGFDKQWLIAPQGVDPGTWYYEELTKAT